MGVVLIQIGGRVREGGYGVERDKGGGAINISSREQQCSRVTDNKIRDS
jgi:hypothetical protein